MASLDLTSFDAMMKELYPKGVPENVASRNRVLLSKLGKKDNFVGDVQVVPIFHGNPPGRSSTFATALANANASAQKKWNVTRAHDYGVVTIDAETIYASKNDMGAFVEARKSQVDMMLDQLGHSLSISLYGDGSGSIGKISAVSGGVITLTNIDDAKNYLIGQKIVANPNLSGNEGSMRSGVGTVTKVNEDEGKITYSGTITSIAQNDFVYTEGDYDSKLKGLAAWFPLTTPSGSESFFGVDRSVDPTRLAGHRLNQASASIEENILTLSERIVRTGGRPDAAFLNHTNFSNLVKGLGSKVEYQGAGGEAGVGFSGVKIHTSAGAVTVYPDPDCPSDRLYVLTMDCCHISHLEGLPHLVTDDGNAGLRQASADGIEIRGRYWAQFICKAPAWCGVAAL
jgi:hypothetical protein